MTPAEALDYFRVDMRDSATPPLWTDAEIYAYLTDAEAMFCRLTDGISDATTTAVVDIAVAADATWLALHPKILKIRGASRTSDGKELTVLNYEDMAPNSIRFDGTTGPLTTLVVGMEENKLRLARAASLADAIKLLVFRMPLATLAGEDEDEVFEIGEHHHLHLLKWAKHLAYLKQDAETFNKSKSDDLALEFRSYCALAKIEQGKKRHKVRTVAYGGY